MSMLEALNHAASRGLMVSRPVTSCNVGHRVI